MPERQAGIYDHGFIRGRVEELRRERAAAEKAKEVVVGDCTYCRNRQGPCDGSCELGMCG